MIEILGVLLIVLLALGLIFLIRFYIAYRLAPPKDAVLWGVISFFTVPFIIWIILLIMKGNGEK